MNYTLHKDFTAKQLNLIIEDQLTTLKTRTYLLHEWIEQGKENDFIRQKEEELNTFQQFMVFLKSEQGKRLLMELELAN